MNRLTGATVADQDAAIAGELAILARRFRLSAKLFSEPMFYRCVGPEGGSSIGGCSVENADCATGDSWSCAGVGAIFMCPQFWTSSPARTVAPSSSCTETFHINFANVGESVPAGSGGHYRNASCYSRSPPTSRALRSSTPAHPETEVDGHVLVLARPAADRRFGDAEDGAASASGRRAGRPGSEPAAARGRASHPDGALRRVCRRALAALLRRDVRRRARGGACHERHPGRRARGHRRASQPERRRTASGRRRPGGGGAGLDRLPDGHQGGGGHSRRADGLPDRQRGALGLGGDHAHGGVGRRKKDWDGTRVKEVLSAGTNDCDKSPGCANTSAQAGNSGSTWSVGQESPAASTTQLGEVVPKQAARKNSFFDLHVQGGGSTGTPRTGRARAAARSTMNAAGSSSAPRSTSPGRSPASRARMRTTRRSRSVPAR